MSPINPDGRAEQTIGGQPVSVSASMNSITDILPKSIQSPNGVFSYSDDVMVKEVLIASIVLIGIMVLIELRLLNLHHQAKSMGVSLGPGVGLMGPFRGFDNAQRPAIEVERRRQLMQEWVVLNRITRLTDFLALVAALCAAYSFLRWVWIAYEDMRHLEGEEPLPNRADVLRWLIIPGVNVVTCCILIRLLWKASRVSDFSDRLSWNERFFSFKVALWGFCCLFSFFLFAFACYRAFKATAEGSRIVLADLTLHCVLYICSAVAGVLSIVIINEISRRRWGGKGCYVREV